MIGKGTVLEYYGLMTMFLARVIEEYERARALYGNSDEQLFHVFLGEAEQGVARLKEIVREKLGEGNLSVEQQKKLIGEEPRV